MIHPNIFSHLAGVASAMNFEKDSRSLHGRVSQTTTE
jgi:hypothetical protein